MNNRYVAGRLIEDIKDYIGRRRIPLPVINSINRVTKYNGVGIVVCTEDNSNDCFGKDIDDVVVVKVNYAINTNESEIALTIGSNLYQLLYSNTRKKSIFSIMY